LGCVQPTIFYIQAGTCSIIIEFVLAWDMNRTRKTRSGHISQYGLWTCKDKTALKLWFVLLIFSNNYHFYLLSAAAHLNLGIVLSDMGHFEKALKVWNIFMTDSVGMLYLNLSIAKNSVRKMIKWSKPILQEVEVILQMNFTYKSCYFKFLANIGALIISACSFNLHIIALIRYYFLLIFLNQWIIKCNHDS